MSESDILLALGGIGLLGLGCQWLAWRLRLPAILFLLLGGVLIGPILGWLEPGELFGPLLFPMVSLAVAVILFEGSLTLRIDELTVVGPVVKRLMSVGILINWAVITFAAHWLFDFDWDLALLFGSLTVVTGPTVIAPILRVVRPKAAVATVLRWEGILIDPLGALLAVVVYSFIVARGSGEAWTQGMQTFGAVILCGSLLGVAGGWALGQLLRRRWLPEFLHSLAALTSVFTVFVSANLLVHESGLLAVTLMGMWLANMKDVDMRHILYFKEDLSLVLISVLFIVLAARLDVWALLQLGPMVLVLLAILQLVARPISVLASSLGSSLEWRERALLAWIAPRGIVAAAVSSVFAIRLEEFGHERAALLVPLTFAVILGTVVLQSATARPLARLLKVAEPAARGFLILGANPVARALGGALQELGVRVMLTDSSWACIREARMANLPTYYGNPNSQHADTHLDRSGLGNLLAASPSDELNSLTSMRFRQDFGVERLFSLGSEIQNRRSDKHRTSEEHCGRLLGHPPVTYQKFSDRLARGATLNITTLSDEFGWEDYQALHGDRATLLFLRDDKDALQAVTAEQPPTPQAGWTLLALLDPERERGRLAESGRETPDRQPKADPQTALRQQEASPGQSNSEHKKSSP